MTSGHNNDHYPLGGTFTEFGEGSFIQVVGNREYCISILDAPFVVFSAGIVRGSAGDGAIVTLGAVKMHGLSIHIGDTFYRMASPGGTAGSGTGVVHGITPAEYLRFPETGIMLSEFANYAGTAVLVGYDMGSSRELLQGAFARLRGKEHVHPVIDIEVLMRAMAGISDYTRESLFATESRGDLVGMAQRFGISIHGMNNPLKEAYVTAQLFQQFIPQLILKGVHSVCDMMQAGKP